MLCPSDEMMQNEDIEFMEFQQELEQESRLHRRQRSDMNDNNLASKVSLTTISSFLAVDNSWDDNGRHDIDVGVDLDLDHESSSNEKDTPNDKDNDLFEKVATTPKTAATTKVDECSTRKSRRRRGIPKDISVKDGNEDATPYQLFLLDQQIVLEQFGIYSDLSEEEEEESEEKVCCLQDIAVSTLEASVNVGVRLVRDCRDGIKEDLEESRDDPPKTCSSLPAHPYEQKAKEAYGHCYEGIELFANEEDDHSAGHVTELSSEQKGRADGNEKYRESDTDPRTDDVDSDDDEATKEIEAMIGGNQYAVNRSFSSFTNQPGTLCQGDCDVMSQYWERIKLALSNCNDGSSYQAIDAKSQASLFSFFENAHEKLEQKDSLSYSSVDDDGTFTSPFFPVLEKCQNSDSSISNEMDKMISCALPNGLVFCTIWLDHPDYVNQMSAQWDTVTGNTLAIDESDFYIRNGYEVVWKAQCDALSDKRFVEFPHRRTDTHASDLLRCFSWAGDKDHAVVHQLNQVLGEMRRAMERDRTQATKENSGSLNDISSQSESSTICCESAEGNKEIEVVLWSSPTRIFPHFVDVHGNHVSTVHLVREKKTTLLSYSCVSERAETTSFGRIVFFVKTIDSIPSLLSAPSDEMAETEQGEETILEESVVVDDDNGGCDSTDDEHNAKEYEHPHDEHNNEEWSAAERSNVTTMIDNRSRPFRVRYLLKGDTDEEFSEKFGL